MHRSAVRRPIGPGTIALANVVATANVLIGKHVALMPDVVLDP